MNFTPVLSRLSCSLVFVLYGLVNYGQYYDSLNFVDSKWEVQKIARGVKLHTKHFDAKNLFRSNQYISYVEIKRNRNVFDIAAEPKNLRKTSDFAIENNAIVAVNGNFFDTKNGGSVDLTKKDGRVINTSKRGTNNRLAAHQKAAVVIDKGALQIVKWDGFVNWEESLNQEDIMLNGPLLIFEKKQEQLDAASSFNISRHPRTSVGITRRGNVIMLVADGRNKNAYGLSLFELTKLMRWLGCISAINFDGGGSSALWVEKKGIVNHPSDNAKWDHEGERKVANILFVKKSR